MREFVYKLLPLYEQSTGPAREAYRWALLVALTCLEWSAPDWANDMRTELEREDASTNLTGA